MCILCVELRTWFRVAPDISIFFKSAASGDNTLDAPVVYRS
jgi:hypothetical protein